MIGYLEGKVVLAEATSAVISTVSGIGYEVHMATPAMVGRSVELFISHVFRDAGQELYGFATIEQKRLFEMLLEVNGIGPKSAFSLIAHLGHEVVIRSIAMEDVATLKSAPGVGKKSAEQMILSLREKVNKWGVSSYASPVVNKATNNKLDKASAQLVSDGLAACQELGYKEQQVLPVLNRLVQQTSYQSSEDLLKALLKELR